MCVLFSCFEQKTEHHHHWAGAAGRRNFGAACVQFHGRFTLLHVSRTRSSTFLAHATRSQTILSSQAGLPDNIETYGLISGLWTSTFALGAFIGPSVSGLLYDSIGFRHSTIFVIGVHLVVALIIALFMLCDRTPNSYKELADSETLLRSGRESQFFGNGSVDKV